MPSAQQIHTERQNAAAASRYEAAYAKANGDLCPRIICDRGWFELPAGDKVRRSRLLEMAATLEARPPAKLARQPRPVDVWWLSEADIFDHYAAEREAATEQHRDRMKRIDADHNNMLAAFRSHQNKESA